MLNPNQHIRQILLELIRIRQIAKSVGKKDFTNKLQSLEDQVLELLTTIRWSDLAFVTTFAQDEFSIDCLDLKKGYNHLAYEIATFPRPRGDEVDMYRY